MKSRNPCSASAVRCKVLLVFTASVVEDEHMKWEVLCSCFELLGLTLAVVDVLGQQELDQVNR